MRFIATAEHTAGQSTAHCCRQGVWSDPTDGWEEVVEAATIGAAERLAMASLTALAVAQPECDCERKCTAGSERWLSSVSVTLWPLDSEAAFALDAEGLTRWRDNVYGLVPADVLPG